MSTLDELVDRHVTEYNARLKHFDEMIEKAEPLQEQHDREELADLKAHRAELADYVQQLKTSPSQQLLDEGPMAIWEVLAARLDSLVEKVTR